MCSGQRARDALGTWAGTHLAAAPALPSLPNALLPLPVARVSFGCDFLHRLPLQRTLAGSLTLRSLTFPARSRPPCLTALSFDSQWRGFLVLVGNSDRTFFPNMLQLPPSVLEQCLLPSPASAAQGGEPQLQWEAAVKLAAWATAPDCAYQV